MRQGNAGAAFEAYKAGIRASFDRMQIKLRNGEAMGTANPDQHPMNQADIDAYMASPAVAQSAAELTMSDIMLRRPLPWVSR